MKRLLEKSKKVLKDPSYIPWKLQTSLAPKIRRALKIIRRKKSNNRNQIVMLHIGRSGSTALADLLDQHPDIIWDGEIYRKILTKNNLTTLDDKSLSSYIKERTEGLKGISYGYEIKFFHLENFSNKARDQIELLKEQGANYFIVLERKNYLRKIISSVKANKLGLWHQPTSASHSTEKFTLPIEEIPIDGKRLPLKDFLHEYRSRFRDLESEISNENHLWITYEDDISESPIKAFHRIIEFIGLPKANVKVNYGKTNPYPISELIYNYDEVVEYLKGTEFEWMARS